MHPVCLHFSTLYTTLPHNLIKDKLVDLVERTFQRKGSLYIACNDRNAFFTSDAVRNYNLWSGQKVCEALTFLLDNIVTELGCCCFISIVLPVSNIGHVRSTQTSNRESTLSRKLAH